MADCLAIIAAGGSGQRVGGELPKQFININGKPIIAYAVEVFEKSPCVDRIILVAPEDFLEETRRIVDRWAFLKVVAVIAGGTTRQKSVYNALMAIENNPPSVVLVHDAARPFVMLDDIEAVAQDIGETGCAVPVVPVKDTIKVCENGEVSTPDRSTLYAVQTPQGFNYSLLLKAHKKALADGVEGHDDSVLTEQLGMKTKLVECGYHNIKITTREDLILAEHLLKKEN